MGTEKRSDCWAVKRRVPALHAARMGPLCYGEVTRESHRPRIHLLGPIRNAEKKRHDLIKKPNFHLFIFRIFQIL